MVNGAVNIVGFNGSKSQVTAVGLNDEGLVEYYVPEMPSGLVLVCAHDYTKNDGVVILREKDGFALSLSADEKQILEDKIIKRSKMIKKLKVSKNTYEVDNEIVGSANSEIGMSSVATRYFNSSVHVSDKIERIMELLLRGFSLKTLRYYYGREMLLPGLPRDVTIKDIDKYERMHGANPEILQQALPNLQGNVKGYGYKAPMIKEPGGRIEVDIMFPDFNEVKVVADSKGDLTKKTTLKVPTLGGAIAAYVQVDVYSGYPLGYLLKNVSNPLEVVKQGMNELTTSSPGAKVSVFAADIGILTQSEYKVMVPAVEKYLIDKNVHIEVGEAYQHDNGLSEVERTIRTIKELTRFAMLYVLNNPNASVLKFTRRQILMLWGEIFHWALWIIRLKQCPNDPTRLRYEVFHKTSPDLRNIRLLPIFCILYIKRYEANNLDSNRTWWQKGFYVGPSVRVNGAIRVAVKNKRGLVRIVVTSEFKGVSDGGRELLIYNLTNNGLIEDAVADNNTSVITQEVINEFQLEEADTNVSADQGPVDTSSSDQEESQRLLLPDENIAVVNINHEVNDLDSTSGDQVIPSCTIPKISRRQRKKIAAVRKKNATRGVPVIKLDKKSVDPAYAKTYATRKGDRTEKIQLLQTNGRNEASVPTIVEEQVTSGNSNNHNSQHGAATRSRKLLALATTDQVGLTWDQKGSSKLVEVSQPNCDIQADVCHNSNSQKLNDIISEIAGARIFHAGLAIEWSEHEDDDYYYNPISNTYCVLTTADENVSKENVELGYRAVTENVPRSTKAAMTDAVWGDATLQEMSTLTEVTGALVKVNKEIALEDIRNGANCLTILMVFEEKMKDGILVRKVRMVADGRKHTNVLETYAPTPSREEFLIFMHLVGLYNWNYYWCDENRAFLSADRIDKRALYARFPGDGSYYRVEKALYGTKDASRDYKRKVEIILLEKLGLKQLLMCTSMYILCKDDVLQLIVYDHVDDFIFSGPDNAYVLSMLDEFRKYATTDAPILNAPSVLGIEIEREADSKIVKLTMQKKIQELISKHETKIGSKIRKVPMTTTAYIVDDHGYSCLPIEKQQFMDLKGIRLYMQIIGCLIWINGIRFDITFAVLYLSWQTKTPRVHHLDVAYYLVGYLKWTITMPLVLGGTDSLQGHHFWDSSHATGPKSCGITGTVNKVGYNSGSVSVKSTKQKLPHLSSFENELVGATAAFKNANRVNNILTEFNVKTAGRPTVYNDNAAVLEFIRGNNVVKGARHMALRQWYTKLEYQAGKVAVEYLKGTLTPADKVTKPSVYTGHVEFASCVMGLNLLSYDYFKFIESTTSDIDISVSDI